MPTRKKKKIKLAGTICIAEFPKQKEIAIFFLEGYGA